MKSYTLAPQKSDAFRKSQLKWIAISFSIMPFIFTGIDLLQGNPIFWEAFSGLSPHSVCFISLYDGFPIAIQQKI